MRGDGDTVGGGRSDSEERISAVGGEPRVRVLGAVAIDGEPVTRSQAAIVCALALDPAEVVGIDRLLDAVWPTDVPASARSSLQNQMARLRKRFGDGLVETCRGGYRLRATTDAQCFEELVVAGRAEATAPCDAVTLLTRAVSLWNGLPFDALVDHPGADCEATRLVAMRNDAEECLAAARISMGDHEAVVRRLEVLVEIEPYRERRWELLMTALARAGRASEALAAYGRMTGRLSADLGAAPSRHLVRLRELIASGSAASSPVSAREEHRDREERPDAGDLHIERCGGPIAIRQRARCDIRYGIHRTSGGAA